jgi:hypothetical protein
MAHAVLMCALAIYVARREDLTRAAAVAIAALLVVGLLIKHNPVAVPLAITLDIWRFRRRMFVTLLSALLACGATALVVMQLCYGNGWWLGLLSPRQITWRQWTLVTLGTLRFSWIWIVAMTWFVIRASRDRQMGLLPVLLVVSVLVGAAFAGGVGTYRNVYFDVLFTLAMIAGAELTHVSTKPVVCVCLAIVILATGARWVRLRWPPTEEPRVTRAAENDTRDTVRLLRSIDGPVLCQRPLLCYQAGKEFAYDPFLVTQRLANGSLSEATVVALFENVRFAAIQLDEVISPRYVESRESTSAVRLVGEHFTQNVLAAIARHYMPVHESTIGVIYVPRPHVTP